MALVVFIFRDTAVHNYKTIKYTQRNGDIRCKHVTINKKKKIVFDKIKNTLLEKAIRVNPNIKYFIFYFVKFILLCS